jgi:hypothetical protein
MLTPMSRPSRRYLSDGAPPPQQAAPPPTPRPGHGRVWINSVHRDRWAASWQDENRIEDSPQGTRERVITWAQAVPAADRAIFSSGEDDYVDLEEWLARPGNR